MQYRFQQLETNADRYYNARTWSLTGPQPSVLHGPRTQVGWTALHAAINCPAEAAAAATIVKLLLASGAAVDARNGVRAQAALRAGGASLSDPRVTHWQYPDNPP